MMTTPDFAAAQHYALDRLERELSPTLTYHAITHTRDDVVPAAERLAALAGVAGEPLLLLRTAAWYHDLGYIEQTVGHEAIGVRIARATLPRFGYSAAQIDAISALIMATKLPQNPATPLAALLADADLDLLGRDDFLVGNQRLRAELAAAGAHATDAEWYADQLRFFHAHRYFTAAARALRDATKQRNIAALAALLAQCSPGAAQQPSAPAQGQ